MLLNRLEMVVAGMYNLLPFGTGICNYAFAIYIFNFVVVVNMFFVNSFLYFALIWYR